MSLLSPHRARLLLHSLPLLFASGSQPLTVFAGDGRVAAAAGSRGQGVRGGRLPLGARHARGQVVRVSDVVGP